MIKNKEILNAAKDNCISLSEQGKKVLKLFRQRLVVANRSDATVRNYIRSVSKLMGFHGLLPIQLEIDQIIDFLHYLKIEKEVNWRTLKIYVAGLRWYYQHLLNDKETAFSIPYPKEEKTLPQILSRQELTSLFDACKNKKHKVMFRLIYSSGLRRNELIKLKPQDIETHDGQRRVRICMGKGKKDRYTVLSEKVLVELRAYYKSCYPKTYLFNGRRKGEPMSPEGMRHALRAAVERAGLKKNVNMHILRHSFASHSIEEGMNIKSLQYLMGHATLLTTLDYLHVSNVPMQNTFSPLDKWEL